MLLLLFKRHLKPFYSRQNEKTAEFHLNSASRKAAETTVLTRSNIVTGEVDAKSYYKQQQQQQQHVPVNVAPIRLFESSEDCFELSQLYLSSLSEGAADYTALVPEQVMKKRKEGKRKESSVPISGKKKRTTPVKKKGKQKATKRKDVRDEESEVRKQEVIPAKRVRK